MIEKLRKLCDFLGYYKDDLIIREKNVRNRSRTERIENNIPIPVFLKECYCNKHNKFNQYYLKYSKKGLCQLCLEKKNEKKFYAEKFKEEEISCLIKKKKEELKKEEEFISSIREKFDECIKSLQIRFQKNISNIIKMHIKKD